VRHRPAHAMPSGHTKRIRIPSDDGTRHARGSIETQRSLGELGQSLAHAPRIAGWVVFFVGSRVSARNWGVRPVRTRAFRVALFICVVGAGFITAAPSLSSGDGTLRANRATHRSPQTASGSTAPQLRISEQPPKDAAPATASMPSVSAPQKDRLPAPQGGLSLDMQITTPPAPDDPDLEQALSGLDRQADLEQQMRHQLGLGDQPPIGPTAAPPALPDGQAPGPPPLSTSATGPLPQSSPSATAAPTAKPSGTYSGQPTARWTLFIVAGPHRDEGAACEEV
jgi:hypothetical protein